MPLSDHEQRILDEIEKNLSREDPRFARKGREPSRFSGAGRLKLGALVFALGFAALILFFVSQLLLVGVIGFAGMVAGIVLASAALGSLTERRTDHKERLNRLFEGWEERVRRRTKRD